MKMIPTAEDVNTLAKQVPTTGGVYFVTAFSGLLAPYWDPGAAGMLIGMASYFLSYNKLFILSSGLSSYTNPCHIARATLEANAFQTRAIVESMKLDSKVDLKHLKVDGGMTNGDMAMEVLADIGGFSVIRPEMREYVSLFPSKILTHCSLDLPRLDQHCWPVRPSASLAGTSRSRRRW
jgi:glycerol kinase